MTNKTLCIVACAFGPNTHDILNLKGYEGHVIELRILGGLTEVELGFLQREKPDRIILVIEADLAQFEGCCNHFDPLKLFRQSDLSVQIETLVALIVKVCPEAEILCLNYDIGSAVLSIGYARFYPDTQHDPVIMMDVIDPHIDLQSYVPSWMRDIIPVGMYPQNETHARIDYAKTGICAILLTSLIRPVEAIDGYGDLVAQATDGLPPDQVCRLTILPGDDKVLEKLKEIAMHLDPSAVLLFIAQDGTSLHVLKTSVARVLPCIITLYQSCNVMAVPCEV